VSSFATASIVSCFLLILWQSPVGERFTVVLEDAVVHFGQVSVYDEQGNIIDQYANPDMANTESIIPAGSPIETVAEAAKVIYEIKTNPE